MLTTVRPERLDAEKRKKQIVQVALALVAKHGADAVSTQLIAETIGFTQAAVFRHFPTKEALWLAVMDWLNDRLEEVRQRRVPRRRTKEWACWSAFLGPHRVDGASSWIGQCGYVGP